MKKTLHKKYNKAIILKLDNQTITNLSHITKNHTTLIQFKLHTKNQQLRKNIIP